MANIATSNDWPSGVYQYADGDVLDGGASSSEVLPFKQLSNRSLFQRLANVTPWDSALATEFGYPSKAVVMHAGVSWRAVIANNVEPGTDPTKWERWGYSAAELSTLIPTWLPYGAPAVCANGGPVDPADKTKVFKSALGEYWMWLGDAWQVVAGMYTGATFIASNAITANIQTAIVQVTAPRSGTARVRGIFSGLNKTGSLTVMSSTIRRNRGGVITEVEDSYVAGVTTFVGQYAQARPYAMTAVQVGDIYTLMGLVSQDINPSPLNSSSIYLEYKK